jgi:hypothetical protein
MAEDKADLEKGRYRVGRAPGNVASLLAELRTEAARARTDAGRAIVVAACVVSAADASMHEAERDALRSVAKEVGVDAAVADATVRDLAASTAFAAEARAAGAALAEHGVVREGMLAAAVVALVSEGMSLGELAALRAVADGAGFPDEQVGALVERVDTALSSR